MKWIAELQVVWVLGDKRAPGRIAIGEPEMVPDGDGEAICPVALEGLQQVTRVHGEGRFHALLQGVHSLEMQLRILVAKGVRVVLTDLSGTGEAKAEAEPEDPEHETEFLLKMFRPFDETPPSQGPDDS